MLPAKKPKPSASACLTCRDRHLKCDGHTPVCARCASSGSPCVFVRSRRGRRADIPKDTATASNTPSINVSHHAGSHQNLFPLPQHGAEDEGQSSYNIHSEETTSIPGTDNDRSDEEYLIGLYYRYIHPAHPFALPEDFYRRNTALFPAHLKKAMCFIASHHTTDRRPQCPKVDEIVEDTSTPEDAFRVQSLIIITLTSYARFERDNGNRALTAAIAMASKINLDSDSFGRGHEDLFRESWRRTWWELYTITGLISLIGGTNVRLTQPLAMTLPYSCEIYKACQTAQAGTTEQIQERFYSVPTLQWSSFAYRVEAMRIMSTVLDGFSDSTALDFDSMSASISSYLLSLPATKSEGLNADGDVDEVMTCALMIIHLAAICLNFPRSRLAQVGGFSTVCGTDRGRVASGGEDSYSVASLRSARALTKLISTHTSLKTLSPCFACAVAFSAVVQLSQYTTVAPPKPPYLRENLQLQLTALQSLGEIWPIAHVVRSQLAQFLREVISKAPSKSIAASAPPPIGDQLMTEDQWLQDVMNEELLFDGGGIPFFGMPFTE